MAAIDFSNSTKDVTVTGAVTVTGGATEAKQDTQITQETLTNTRLGDPNIFGFSSFASLWNSIASILDTRLKTSGQATMANSSPVVLASDQVLPLPTGAATSNLQASIISELQDLKGRYGASVGQKGNAASLAVAISSEQEAILSAMSAKLPATLGQKTMANSLPVTVASDQGGLSVFPAPQPAVGGFTTNHKLIAANTTNATSVKASAATVGTVVLCNNSATVYYFKLYNKASAPTVGTDVPVMVFMIPANTTIAVSQASGMRLTTGLAYALTTGIADSDATAVPATTLIVNISYT